MGDIRWDGLSIMSDGRCTMGDARWMMLVVAVWVHVLGICVCLVVAMFIFGGKHVSECARLLQH